MRQTRIVTDSASEIDPQVAADLGILVVPLQLHVRGETVADSAELRQPSFHEGLVRDKTVPQVVCPPMADFREVYARLIPEVDDIVSVHVSTLPCNTYRPAAEAASSLLGRARIEVVDAAFMSAGLGAIVTKAARAARDGADGTEVVRLVRGLIPHTYFAFYVDSLTVLRRSGALQQGDHPLPTSSSAKPLFVMEEGVIVQQFRVRKKGSALERLVDFVNEFLAFESVTIVHSGLMPEVHDLREALAGNERLEAVHEHIYGPAVAALLGPKALGVVVVESGN